jgi:2-polyprenyl-3-methyl-5-hydroxy-6-metoxy-1,4-benzoquinol methylase
LDPNYSETYGELYTRHWWWRAREEMVLQLLRKQFGSRSDLQILDIGCGDGLFFDSLEEFGEVEGIEAASDLIAPQGIHRTRIHVGQFDESFRPRKHYSLILMLDVLEHLDHPEAALRHAGTLLELGGLLLITVPAFRLLWTNHDILNQHRTRFTKAGLRNLLERGRLRVLDGRYFFAWLFAAKLCARAIEGVVRSKPVVPRVPAPWLNNLLWRFSRAENSLALRLSFPFGSSLLVLATPKSSS